MHKVCSRCGGLYKKGSKCVCAKHSGSNELNNRYWRDYLRPKIIARDGGYCQRCMALHDIYNNKNLTVHHIKSRKYYKELIYDESNLITICRDCNSYLGADKPLDFEW